MVNCLYYLLVLMHLHTLKTLLAAVLRYACQSVRNICVRVYGMYDTPLVCVCMPCAHKQLVLCCVPYGSGSTQISIIVATAICTHVNCAHACFTMTLYTETYSNTSITYSMLALQCNALQCYIHLRMLTVRYIHRNTYNTLLTTTFTIITITYIKLTVNNWTDVL
jgi:hypothetical protein